MKPEHTQIVQSVIENGRVSTDWRGHLLKDSLEDEVCFEGRERGLTTDEVDDLIEWALDAYVVSDGKTVVVEVVEDGEIDQDLYNDF